MTPVKTASNFVLFLLLLIATLWTLDASANNTLVRSVDCQDFINEAPPRVICGFVSVARNHDTPQGDRIELPVLIAQSTRSLTANNDRAILIPGAGGPGAGMGFGYAYNDGEFLAPYQSLRRAGYDVVIADQRGAGFSRPKLTCQETIETFKALVVRPRTLNDEISHYREAIANCRKRLTDSIGDISPFDSRQSATDFLYIIDNLPYRWWGTIATSYATTLAQAMIMLRPNVFGAAVLDSPVPLDYQQPLTAESTYQSIIKTINRCEQNTSCSKRYPRLVSQFDKLLQSAQHIPFRIKVKVYDDSGSTQRKTLAIDDDALLTIFSTAIYNNESIALLPSVIRKMANGHHQAIKLFAENFWYQSTDADYADGLSVTVHCKERQMLEEQFAAENPAFLSGLSNTSRQALQAQVDLCKTWRIASDNKLLPTAAFPTRTLILAGSLDPVISQSDIENTADNFNTASIEIVPGAGHSVWFQSECTRENVVQFFNKENEVILTQCESSLPSFR